MFGDEIASSGVKSAKLPSSGSWKPKGVQIYPSAFDSILVAVSAMLDAKNVSQPIGEKRVDEWVLRMDKRPLIYRKEPPPPQDEGMVAMRPGSAIIVPLSILQYVCKMCV